MVSGNGWGRTPGGGSGRPEARVLTPDQDELAHLELILNGACPLPGFMTREQAASVDSDGRLPGGAWPVPVTLTVPEHLADAERLVLADPEGFPLAELTVTERWESSAPDHGEGRVERRHVAGDVALANPPMGGVLRKLRVPPAEVRGQRELGPDHPLLAVVTDRPLHHRALHQIRDRAKALGHADVLVMVDAPLEDEGLAPAVLAAEPLLSAHTRFVVCTLPRSAARSEGPLGGRWGARDVAMAGHVAAAYGATHMMVEAGPAGADVEGAKALEPPVALVAPEPWSYDTASAMWRPSQEVPEEARRAEPDDAEVAAELAHGRELAAWFTPARVGAELARLRPARTRRGLTLLFTGLSGSGKSTIAQRVREGINRAGRTVTLLDGDVVRLMLSKGLTFSREDREMNVRRIGYVASEITRHGGVAVCAPIAPYARSRAEVRAMVEEYGDFFLVHVATPLEVCEERDRKGLYAKARAGEIPEFTGVSDPYEEPTDADMVIHTVGEDPHESAARVLAALREGGWLPDKDR
ncbi:adenylyl-sulfate kinase [Nocardiopsis lucentensis]|uniref:adenylyl-sulfate kinase n=1 Tax=Nocardiopsis lucentensis TaxID=53441 RepID=UPI00035D5BBD|nr:adenylyl-sulfate kinase [Nocardiopsis lucentensis]